LVVELSLNGVSNLVEPPDLSVSSVLGLDNHISIVDQVKILMGIHSRDNVEWSLDIESEVFIEFSLSWLTLPFISLDNFPLLGNSVIWLLVDSDVSVLVICVGLNRKSSCLVILSFIQDLRSFNSEQLPPS
jgi:hypothetical protein